MSREGEMNSIIKWLLGLYSVVGLITLLFQASIRYSECVGSMGCGLSFAKGIAWSVIWPIYWAIQWNWLKF